MRLLDLFAGLLRKDLAPRTAPRIDGTLELLPKLISRFVPSAHDVLLYLPPGYSGESARRYPVLYMQDGQNLFDPATAFIRGKDWRLGETLESLFATGDVEPLIVVGVYNAGAERVNEYTPTRDARRNLGGQADLYMRLLTEELKPYVDSRFRTRADPGSTGIGGSSLGGLVAVHGGLTRPDVFGRVAAMSPSVWWDGERMVRFVEELPSRGSEDGPPLPVSIWLDMGTREGDEALVSVRRFRDALLAKGWRKGRDLAYHEARGGGHDELAWARRADRVLKFLFPFRRAERGVLRMAEKEASA